jgi:hypothetical protein
LRGPAPMTTSLPPIEKSTPLIWLLLRGTVKMRGLLTIGILLSFVAPGHSWHPNSTCWIRSEEENVLHNISPLEGIVVYYVPYLWCTDKCIGLNRQASADFVLILLGFALPAIIFSTVIPRRWRLDLPEQFFKTGRGRILTISKLAFSLPAICLVAALDMIGWITCIMTFAGPMIFGGVQEMLLDYRAVQFLKRNLGIPAKEKLEAVVALLCGNFDQDPDDPTTRIHASLIPSKLTEATLESTKSRLITIMNAQTSFGMTIGIPAVFFVASFLYNAAQPSPTGAVSFGIFWMVLVLVTIVSGTLIAGNSPNAVSVLMVNHIRRLRPRLLLLNDMYNSELYPVPMWNRGFSKYRWLKNTTLWQDQLGVERGLFKKRIEFGRWSWVVIAIATWLLVAIPCLLSWSFDYLLPWPWLGCLSLLYTIYLTTQTWLIIVALVLAYLNAPFHNVWRSLHSLSEGTPRSIFLRSCLLIFTAVTGAATLTAAVLTVVGSIFQLSDRFDTCFCSTTASSWLQPAPQRISFLYFEYTSQSYHDYTYNLDISLYWGAAAFTCIICFLGWWYQRSLRGALREVIEDIKL